MSTEAVEAWVRAEMVSFIAVGETHLTGRTLVHYNIENAPVKEFNLRVPAAWKNVDIIGPGVRRRDQKGDVWRVESKQSSG